MKVLMFAYGPEVDPDVLTEAIDEEWILSRKPARVEGFHLVFSEENRDEPASVETEDGAFLEGVLYELKPTAFRPMDDIYGYPELSDHLVVSVECEEDEVEDVRMYIPVESSAEQSPSPSRNEIEILLAVGDVFSDAYRKWLEQELEKE